VNEELDVDIRRRLKKPNSYGMRIVLADLKRSRGNN